MVVMGAENSGMESDYNGSDIASLPLRYLLARGSTQ